MQPMGEPCSICGGDGRITNSFGGSSATCPSCHGNGRRSAPTGFHDVTKTKPSHHAPAKKHNAPAPPKPQWPATAAGEMLAREVQSASCPEDTKIKLIRETIEHEETHGQCTQTFLKKIRKQIRPAAAR